MKTNIKLYNKLGEIVNISIRDSYLNGEGLLTKGRFFKKTIRSVDSKVLDICYEKNTNGVQFYSELNSKLNVLLEHQKMIMKQKMVDVFKFSSNVSSDVDFSVVKNDSIYEHYQFKIRTVDNVVSLDKLEYDHYKYIESLSDYNMFLGYDVTRLSVENQLKMLEIIKSSSLLSPEFNSGRLFLDFKDAFLLPDLINRLEGIEYCNQILLLTN